MEGKNDYVIKLQTEYAKNHPDKVGVFVIPFFTEAGELTNTVVRDTASQSSMVEVMSYGGVIYFRGQGLWKLDIRRALIFGPASDLRTMYRAGQNIGGKIAIRYGIN